MLKRWRCKHTLLDKEAGNVRTHLMFRPRSSTFLTQLATKWRRDKKNFIKYISVNNQPMEYKHATLDGWKKLLTKGLLKRTIKNQTANIIYDQNSISVQKIS